VLMGQVELAMTRAFQGDLPDAVRLCEDVRRVCEDHGERWTRGYALYVLAYAAWADGDLPRARALLAECLAGAHAFHDLLGSVLAVELLALVTVAQGDAAEAAVLSNGNYVVGYEVFVSASDTDVQFKIIGQTGAIPGGSGAGFNATSTSWTFPALSVTSRSNEIQFSPSNLRR